MDLTYLALLLALFGSSAALIPLFARLAHKEEPRA